MKTAVNSLGIMCVSTILTAVPLLTGCAFCLRWPGLVKFPLVIATMLEYLMINLAVMLQQEAEE